jgi:hypothetical protein
MEELLKKHGLEHLIGDDKVKAALKDVAQTFWFRGANYANDRADHVEEDCRHPDRKRSMQLFFGEN